MCTALCSFSLSLFKKIKLNDQFFTFSVLILQHVLKLITFHLHLSVFFYLVSGKKKLREILKVLTKKQTELSRIVLQSNESHDCKFLFFKKQTKKKRLWGQEGTGAPAEIGPRLGFNWHSGWSSYQPKALDFQADEINLSEACQTPNI